MRRSGGRSARSSHRRNVAHASADALHAGIALVALPGGAEEQGAVLVHPDVPVAGTAKGPVDVALETNGLAPIVSSAAYQLCEELAGLQNADEQLVAVRQQMIVVADEHALGSGGERSKFTIVGVLFLITTLWR